MNINAITKNKGSLAIWLLAPAIFLITKNPLTGPWRLALAFFALIWLVIDLGFLAKGNTKRIVTDILVFTLCLVGATNWFFSPFFFSLYLLIIGLTFVLGPVAGAGLTVSLLVLFIFNVGEVDVAYDSLVLLSLLATFPIAMKLRQEYLKLQEAQKTILILEKQAKEKRTTVEELLSNIVTHTTADLRQPLVNIKNHAHVLLTDKKLSAAKGGEYLKKIYSSAVTALTEINRFDEESTGRKIQSASTPKN